MQKLTKTLAATLATHPNVDIHPDYPNQQTHKPTRPHLLASTHSITQPSLCSRWRPFRSPMVLPSSCRRHTLHLRQTCDNTRVAHHRTNVDPEQASKSAVHEAARERYEHKLPCCHINRDEAERWQVAEIPLEFLLLPKALHIGGIVAQRLEG